jgi:hypothetical protein
MRILVATGILAVVGCNPTVRGPRAHAPDLSDSGDGDTPDGPAPGALAQRVLVLDIDGLHGADLARYIDAHPASALATLATDGVRYSSASASRPSDSFPGVLALFTGGTPSSTGVFYDYSYDRSLSPPGSACATTGATVDYTKKADLDASVSDGGGGLDPAVLPLDPDDGCSPVAPHDYLRVNTAFEVVKAETGGRTAWSDKHLSYDILNGPSGSGVDDLWNPEIGANDAEGSLASIEAYDDAKVGALLNEIRGKDHSGRSDADVPTLFGMNFQAVSVEQKSAGYADAAGTPSDGLAEALDHTDASIGRLLQALDDAGLRDDTAIVIAAPHGQSPVDRTLVRDLSESAVPNLVEGVQKGLLAHFTGDDVGLIWLTDATRTADVVAALQSHAATAGIGTVLTGADLALLYPDASDPRTPDIIIEPEVGVIYSDTPKLAEHGGFSPDDLDVALMVSHAGATGVIEDAVETRQVAPTLLGLLGVDPGKLDAVGMEGTGALPGLE